MVDRKKKKERKERKRTGEKTVCSVNSVACIRRPSNTD